MQITVLGLSHKTAPLELREKLNIPKHRTSEILKRFSERRIFDERVLLSTCNRTEIYGAGRNLNDSIKLAKEFLSEYSNLSLSSFEDKLYVMEAPLSIEHLFSVVSGLDSMVLGETEIIGQVKDAYHEAQRHDQTGKILNTLFQRSFKVAKNVRTETRIGAGKVSVASVAVELAEKIFEDLARTRVMVFGTGEMSSQVLSAMIEKGTKPMVVSGRNFEKAESLAKACGGEAVDYHSYEKKIGEVDILITSTVFHGILIGYEQAKAWMRTRHERPLFMIDIAVPRNIDAAVEKLDNIYLYNIDDLKSISDRNRLMRQSQIEGCMRYIRSQSARYMEGFMREPRGRPEPGS